MGVCNACGGSGTVEISVDVVENGFVRIQLVLCVCPACQGSGSDGRKNEDNEDNKIDKCTIQL